VAAEPGEGGVVELVGCEGAEAGEVDGAAVLVHAEQAGGVAGVQGEQAGVGFLHRARGRDGFEQDVDGGLVALPGAAVSARIGRAGGRCASDVAWWGECPVGQWCAARGW